ncbi:DNA methylase domain protein, partial [Leptospira santarosai str. CBC1416]
MNFLISSYSNAGDTILDNCMGSGTTGVACIQTDRNFIGIEKEEEYFELAKRRIEIAIIIRKLQNNNFLIFGKGEKMRELIFKEISEEREKQDLKFGPQKHHPVEWCMILGEEVGE